MPRAGRNLTLGSVLFVVVFALAAVGLYGGAQLVDEEKPASAGGEEETGGTPGGPVAVRIVAQNSSFDKRTITASPNADVTVTLVNQDAGVLHNIAFYTTRSATTKIAVGNLITGPATDELRFKAPARAGNNFFRCDVHPDQMTGTFSVK